MCCAAKLGLAGKGKGAFLQRGFSARKAARSDYEEQQMLLGLKAVEKMKQMVLVRLAFTLQDWNASTLDTTYFG